MGCGSSKEARESAGPGAAPPEPPRGEGAHAAAVDQLVAALRAAAVAAEPRVTALLSTIASEYGAAFVGQEHKIKAEGSLRGKVERFAAQIHRKRQAATDPGTCTWDESHAELYALHTSKKPALPPALRPLLASLEGLPPEPSLPYGATSVLPVSSKVSRRE